MLTDDDTRADFAGNYAETFDADGVGDRDPMYDDAPSGGPKCGGCGLDDEGRWVGPGCRHCCPVDHECKPYGFGIERWEHDGYLRLRRELAGSIIAPMSWEQAGRCALKWSGFSVRRERHSDIVWDRICDESETHDEAVERYTAWARRAVTVRYRDEPAKVVPVTARKAA